MPPFPERPQTNFERDRDIVLADVREKLAERGNEGDLDAIIEDAIEKHSEHMADLRKTRNAEGATINSGIATVMKNSIKSILTGKKNLFGPKKQTNYQITEQQTKEIPKRWDQKIDDNQAELVVVRDEHGNVIGHERKQNN